MIQVERNYVNGTAAKKLEYDVYEENKVLKAKKKAKSDNKAKLKTTGYVMIIFALGFVLMYRYALITEVNYNLNRLERQYTEIRNENSRLKVAIETETDLAKVKELAQQRLGMQEPDMFQIVYVNIPKSDYTAVAESYHNMDKSSKSMFAMLLNKVGKFARLLN